MKSPKVLKLGTRGSSLALAQARQIAEPLQNIEIVTIQTSGDRYKGRRLAEAGGKGLFVKEIEEALLAKKIDLAVHSLKDLPAFLAPGLEFVCYPKREDPRDCFVSFKYKRLNDLPKGAVVGTGSPRRMVQLMNKRPDLKVEPIRGNVDTRLRKLKEGHYDALILASAGLHRLQKREVICEYFEPDFFLPAIGQGILAVETRKEDEALAERLKILEDSETATVAKAERAFLKTIGGDCYTPMSAFARITDGKIKLTGWLSSPDGSKQVRREKEGGRNQAGLLGKSLAEEILDAYPAD